MVNLHKKQGKIFKEFDKRNFKKPLTNVFQSDIINIVLRNI